MTAKINDFHLTWDSNPFSLHPPLPLNRVVDVHVLCWFRAGALAAGQDRRVQLPCCCGFEIFLS